MRALTNTQRANIEDPNNPDLYLTFATIEHPVLSEPIRVVTEDIEGVSRSSDGKIINYKYNGKLYLGCPFSFTMLTDDDQPGRAQLQVQNVNRKVGMAALAINTPALFSFTILTLADFNVAAGLDADNAYSPLGIPDIIYQASHLFLRNVSGDEAQVSADIVPIDIANEPCTAVRTTQDRTPGLYR